MSRRLGDGSELISRRDTGNLLFRKRQATCATDGQAVQVEELDVLAWSSTECFGTPDSPSRSPSSLRGNTTQCASPARRSVSSVARVLAGKGRFARPTGRVSRWLVYSFNNSYFVWRPDPRFSLARQVAQQSSPLIRMRFPSFSRGASALCSWHSQSCSVEFFFRKETLQTSQGLTALQDSDIAANDGQKCTESRKSLELTAAKGATLRFQCGDNLVLSPQKK